ncbi:MAG: phosphoribosyltransferase [Planctomycetes bacterium]|nr:phosphoribosyltransferase [Planctomycetota bacterium]
MKYKNRFEAGRLLTARLRHEAYRNDAVVLALPRGGVPVAFEIASALGLTLDVFLVRKIGLPGAEEVALGAVASGGVRVVNHDVASNSGLSDGEVERLAQRAEEELRRQEGAFRGLWPETQLPGRVVVIVDDGLATGATMRAAVEAIRRQNPARIIVAVPVGASDAVAALREVADEVVCPHVPVELRAVGLHYEDFTQVGDDEVRALLKASRNRLGVLDT